MKKGKIYVQKTFQISEKYKLNTKKIKKIETIKPINCLTN